MSKVDGFRGGEDKTVDSARINAILNLLQRSAKITEGDVTRFLGVDNEAAKVYIKYMEDKGLVEVKRRVFRDAELVLKKGQPEPASEFKKEVKVEVKDGLAGVQAPAGAQYAQGMEQQPPLEEQAEAVPQIRDEKSQRELLDLLHRNVSERRRAAIKEGKVPMPVRMPLRIPEGPQTTPQPAPTPGPEAEVPKPPQSMPEPEKPELTPHPEAPKPLQEPPKPEATQQPEAMSTPQPTPKPEATQQPEAVSTPQPTPKPEATQQPATPAPEPPKPTQKQVEGEKVKIETEEDFYEICRNLTTGFIGLMRLSCEVDGQSYSAGLLILRGDILASTFEHLDEAKVYYGDEAMRYIIDKFVGTKGSLDIYTLTEESLETALEEEAAVLQAPVKLSTLNIKIKSRLAKPSVEEPRESVVDRVGGLFGGVGGEEKARRFEELRGQKAGGIERLKLAGNFSLVNFARDLTKLDPLKARRFEELRGRRAAVPAAAGGDAGGGGPEDLKSKRLDELKAERASRLTLKDVLAGIKQSAAKEERLEEMRRMRDEALKTTVGDKPAKETPVVTVMDGMKITTTIDKLYELVEKHKKLKINDALANTLKISKTQIEEWAMILEEHGLLEVRYPTIGEPEICSKKQAKEEGASDGGKRKQDK